MNLHSGNTLSVWQATQSLPPFQPLHENLNADVCIVGAGIAGLTTAYLLGQSGRKVVVLDDGPVVSGETERTTAHLASALDDRFYELERLHGPEGARLAAQSHAAAIDRIESISSREQIDCDFMRLDGYLFVPLGESSAILGRELSAAQRVDLEGVTLVPRIPLTFFDTGPALRFPNQGQFHPLKYLAGLLKAIVRDGGRVFTHTRAVSMSGGSQAQVQTVNGHTIRAAAVVVATNTPVNDMFAIHTKQAPYRTYAIAARVPAETVPKALYWDTLDPYHYVRLQAGDQPGTELLIVGGEDHKTAQAQDYALRFDRLEAWTRERFPIRDVAFRWSGQVMEPVDGLAFIGRNPGDAENVYIATGDSGQGMTHGTIAGILITDLICGRDNPWRELYDPARKNLRSVGEFARENLNVAAQYTDYLSRGEATSAEQVRPGNGALIRRGTKKFAVYCDEHGQRHAFSAVCPHMGCIVAWNPVERSWDCPCHGSRFNAEGEVLNGPAITGLKPAPEVLEHEPAKV